MGTSFDLLIQTYPEARRAELRLADAAGNQLAWREVRLGEHPASRWEGLFDLRRYVHRYAGNLHPLGEGEPLDEEDLVRELGVFLGREVLGGADSDSGRNLFSRLAPGPGQRTLCLRLPGAGDDADSLAAAFARVPWEIARLAPGGKTLAEGNLVLRALVGEEPIPGPLALTPGEPLRVLLVFAEAAGSRNPLALRRERAELLSLFHREIYPQRRVEVDTLCYGVTRERLVAQIQARGGYHVLHWSGHGHLNLLELYAEGPEPSRLSGPDLVDLFDQAGYVPRLVFLSACHSGELLRLKDWAAFQAVIEGREPAARATTSAEEALRDELADRPGYTGTAHALLAAGIPTVVAMRYEVGDDYARDLARGFYARLLADVAPKKPDEALNQARKALLVAAARDEAHYAACDPATPMLYGTAETGLVPPQGYTSPPAIHPPLRAGELQPHRDFVGRSDELTRLGSRWLDHEGRHPVAVVRGLGGLGKTALAAEAVGLWHERFRWVFVFQAKPVALPLDDFHRQLHATWAEQQKEYARRVEQYPAEAVWRPAVGGFTGTARQARLRESLVEALRAEPVLLVLDNFESCLSPTPAAAGGHPCQDPAWDDLLQTLAAGLVGSNSRVLLTSRWPLAALAGGAPVVDLSLGPLPPGEAALFVREHEDLRRVYFASKAGKDLVLQVVGVSRGHPLLLDRLGRLARQDPAALAAALTKLKDEGLGQLPGFFATNPKDAAERKYLEDALAGSIDLLLERVRPAARQALWVLALANEPVTVGLWRRVWAGRDFAAEQEEQQLRRLKGLLENLEALPLEVQARLRALPAELKATIDALGDEPPRDSAFETLRHALVQSGLVTERRENETDENPDCTCHELVRERITAWMKNHPAETDGRSREQLWAAYGERLASVFEDLLAQNERGLALEAGSRALRYVVRAGAFEKLGQFASQLITSTNDPSVLSALLPELRSAADAAPPGRVWWCARTYLADGLRLAGLPDSSLEHYAAAAAAAETAEQWSDLAWITGNWANALQACNQLEASQEKHRESARWEARAGRPEAYVVGSELEALRIDVMLGRAREALEEIQPRLDRVRGWWQAEQSGATVPEAPDVEILGRLLLSALDIADDACLALSRWQERLNLLDEKLVVKRARGAAEHELAEDRFNRHGPLLELGQLNEAKSELEHCLEVFTQAGDTPRRASVLSALASIANERGDLAQGMALHRGSLALRNTLSAPVGRGTSHFNLANSFFQLGRMDEAAAHELASLVYFLAVKHSQHLTTWGERHVRHLRQAGSEHTLPRVADLIARPDFAPLKDWLTQRQVDVEELQAVVDIVVSKCRQKAELDAAAAASPSPTEPTLPETPP